MGNIFANSTSIDLISTAEQIDHVIAVRTTPQNEYLAKIIESLFSVNDVVGRCVDVVDVTLEIGAVDSVVVADGDTGKRQSVRINLRD